MAPFRLASSTTGRILWTSTGAVTAYGTYKAIYDPPHLVWDLDNTLLCSVSPLPPTDLGPSSGRYDSFDQVDDDFPFDASSGMPNTRTYWRPGARTALRVLGVFAVQHVFTAAQETYTENILQQMDRSLFHTVVHRDRIPQPDGKDLQEIVALARGTFPRMGLHRCILWDDRTQNFRPQRGENGVHVVPFDVVISRGPWADYREIVRWIGISMLALLAPDVRIVLPFFQSPDHKNRFSNQEEPFQ